MKHLKVAEARVRFGEILDEAEKGEPVFIERRGVRFRVVAEPRSRARAPKPSLFEFVHREVAAGQWTWTADAGGLRFAARSHSNIVGSAEPARRSAGKTSAKKRR
jgi:prevent-host-death family protein